MKSFIDSTSIVVLFFASTGIAAAEKKARTVRYAPAAGWVVPPPVAPPAPMPPGAPLRVIYQDSQVRVTPAGLEEYQAMRLQLLTPEGLAAGNLIVAWSPANEEVVVNRLAIVRDGKSIDVLAKQKFSIIQRENNLEQSMLDGNLTATLQTAGLQVGDELEFAVTRHHRETNAGARPQGFAQFPITGMRGAYRMRIVQAEGLKLDYRASANVPAPVVREGAAESEREYAMIDPASASVPDGAPGRYAITRLIQFSGYGDWTALSRTFAPLYTAAAALPAGSKVRAEADRIAASTRDPVARAEAVLRLVQDQIRYVYVGLDGGNYRPAAAEDSWQRRFGDCKAKTVLLIALLREMGIEAEPVLVATKGGDGIDERLPSPALFDHVVVRATIDGRSVWLDGTRLGDRKLALLDAPAWRWGLPLRQSGAALERIQHTAPRYPARIQAIEIDASSGFDKPGKFRVQHTLRGDEIFAMRAQLAGVAPSDADKLLNAYWRQQMSDVEPETVSWRFDDENRLLVLAMDGEGKVDWEGDASQGRTHYFYGGGSPPPDRLKRPKDQPQDAPWATDFSAFSCYATTVRVPPPGKNFHWTFSAKPMARTIGGVDYWRISSFDGTVARMVKSRRAIVPEITAAEATTANASIDGFDNSKSYIWEAAGAGTSPGQAFDGVDAKFGSFADFAGPTPPCQRSSALTPK